MIEIEDFHAHSFEDFAKSYLQEKSLIRTPTIGGELSKRMSKVNIENAEEANKWANKIYNQINRFVAKAMKKAKKTGKELDLKLSLKKYKMSDWTSQEMAIVDVLIGKRRKLEINIHDSNTIWINLPEDLAKKYNKGERRKVLRKIDKVGDYVIGLLERVIWQ